MANNQETKPYVLGPSRRTRARYDLIIELIDSGMSERRIASATGISRSTIARVKAQRCEFIVDKVPDGNDYSMVRELAEKAVARKLRNKRKSLQRARN